MEEENLVKKEEKPIKKETITKKEKKGNKEKIILIIIISLLVVGVLVLVYFKFIRQTDKELVFYQYQDKLFVKSFREEKDVDKSKIKEYTYECRYDQCYAIGSDDYAYGSFDNKWILISDSNIKEEYSNYECTARDGDYYLYNVETGKKKKVSLEEGICFSGILLDDNNEPKSLIVYTHDIGYPNKVIDIKTGKSIINVNDIVFSESGYYYSKNIKAINNNTKKYYLLELSDYSGNLLYDENGQYITNISSEDYFDDEGNIIKTFNDKKTNKEYFKVFNVSNKLLRTSKMYDNVYVDNGYIITVSNGVVNITDSRENVLINITKNGKKNTYSVYNNKFYGKEGLVSLFETQNSNSDKIVTQYTYNVRENKLEKNKIDYDGLSSASYALSIYFSNGYSTYKISNTTIFVDNELSDSKKEELKELIDNLSKDRITKKLFNSKQNIYLFTKYDYDRYRVGVNTNNAYNSTAIPVYMDTRAGSIVLERAVNYFNNNYKKLNNSSFSKLYEKYYSYYDNGISHYTTYTYYESGFFGIIMSSYFSEESNWKTNVEDYSGVSSTRYNIIQKDNIDKFDDAVKKYIESYVLK